MEEHWKSSISTDTYSGLECDECMLWYTQRCHVGRQALEHQRYIVILSDSPIVFSQWEKTYAHLPVAPINSAECSTTNHSMDVQLSVLNGPLQDNFGQEDMITHQSASLACSPTTTHNEHPWAHVLGMHASMLRKVGLTDKPSHTFTTETQLKIIQWEYS